MLGYLSLPVAAGGQGRTDVDGLKGSESNPYQGQHSPRFHSEKPSSRPTLRTVTSRCTMRSTAVTWTVSSRVSPKSTGDQGAGKIMGHHTASHGPGPRRARTRLRYRPPLVRSPSRSDLLQPLLRVDRSAEPRPRGFWEFDDSSPIRPVFTETIFDYLSGRHRPRHREAGYLDLLRARLLLPALLRALHVRRQAHRQRRRPRVRLLRRRPRRALPSVSFIDPHFVELPPGGNSDGPPADVSDGQDLVRRVVEAVVASPAWDKTMLVIVYDEHGGFYDHVPPPAPPVVSADLPITTYGVRVPAVSWCRRGFGAAGERVRSDAGASGDPTALHLRPHLDPEDDRPPLHQRAPTLHGRPLRRRERPVDSDAGRTARTALPTVHPVRTCSSPPRT